MNYEIVPNCQVENLNQIYLDYFGYQTKGTFVEVGAYDGYNFSNTWGLAKIGWRGIYIEPISEHARLCRENHKDNNVTVIQCAAGNYTGKIQMQVAGTVSTYAPLYINSEVWKGLYHNKVEEVWIDKLDYILASEIIPDEFDLLVIDTEGSELEVLQGFDLNYWKPRMVIIESHEKNPFEELTVLAPEIDKYFSSYKKIYAGEINTIYVNDKLRNR